MNDCVVRAYWLDPNLCDQGFCGLLMLFSSGWVQVLMSSKIYPRAHPAPKATVLLRITLLLLFTPIVSRKSASLYLYNNINNAVSILEV